MILTTPETTPETPLKASYTLEFDAAPYLKARRLTVLLNGQPLGQLNVEALQTFRLEGLKLQPGENLLVFRPDPQDGYLIPAEQDPAQAGQDLRHLTITVLGIRLS